MIRLGTSADLAAATSVYRRASLSNAGDRDNLLAHPEYLVLGPEGLAGGRTHVAEEDGSLAGFATWIETAGIIELEDLFVDPGYMRRGVSVRGWLQVDRKQREAVESIIAAAHQDLYSGGWGFPVRPFSWSLYIFYGGDIKEAGLPWLRSQVSEIAGLPAVDDDGDMPLGLFLVSDERGAVSTWQIRDGALHGQPSPEFAWVLRE